MTDDIILNTNSSRTTTENVTQSATIYGQGYLPERKYDVVRWRFFRASLPRTTDAKISQIEDLETTDKSPNESLITPLN